MVTNIIYKLGKHKKKNFKYCINCFVNLNLKIINLLSTTFRF